MNIQQIQYALSAEVAIALADDDRDGVPDPGVLEDAWRAAETEVRQALARGGFAPDAPLVPVLEDLTVTLAVERLFERRREMTSEPWRERAERARAMLREIGEGRHPLPGVPRRRPRFPGPEKPPLHRHSTLRRL